MAKIPWHFFKIPWQFPDLEKNLFFPDFSLTRGNPVYNVKERGDVINYYLKLKISLFIRVILYYPRLGAFLGWVKSMLMQILFQYSDTLLVVL